MSDVSYQTWFGDLGAILNRPACLGTA